MTDWAGFWIATAIYLVGMKICDVIIAVNAM